MINSSYADRGALTITIAHITFPMAFVAVVVQSRLRSLDESLIEAAMDLGGRPYHVALDITLTVVGLGVLIAGFAMRRRARPSP